MHAFDRQTDRILIATPRLHSMQRGKKVSYPHDLLTALHGMQSRYSDGNSVCPSVCLSNACIVTKRKKSQSRFLYHAIDNLV